MSSCKKLLIWIPSLIILFMLLGIGFCYLEPIKARRIERYIKSLDKILFAEERTRKGEAQPYHPVELNMAHPQDSQSTSISEDQSVRLLDESWDAVSGPVPEKVSISLDGQQRNAMAGVVPFRTSVHFKVPKDGVFWFGMNQVEGSASKGLFAFQVQVANGAEIVRTHEFQLSSGNVGWKDHAVDLGEFGGQEVQIQLSVNRQNPSPAEETVQEPVKVYWSDLFVGTPLQSAQKPNIFIILIDTLRPDHLGCYGYKRSTSPRIDKMAVEGIRFENAFSQAPWTNPSILSLFTGLYPSDLWEPLPHDEAIQLAIPSGADTLAEILSVHGYFTIGASDHPGIKHRLFGQGFDIYEALYHMDGPYIGWRETEAKKILQRMHTLLRSRSDSPLFTYLHLIYPHQPYEAPPPYEGLFGPGAFYIKSRNRDEVLNMYDAEIKRTDDVIRDFLADLQQSGLDKKSVVILLSDHGEGFWEHRLWEHGNSLYNELLRVPMIFYAPGRLPQGLTFTHPVEIVDMVPTILDMAGIEYNGEDFRGTSLLSLIRNENERNSARLTFSEFPYKRIISGKAIQSLNEKLIFTEPGRPNEYYDLHKDPGELHNLSNVGLQRISDLIRRISEIGRHAAARRAKFPVERQEPSKELMDSLKSLGYVQ